MTGRREALPALRVAGGIVLVVLVVALELGGCAKKGAPSPPPGVPDTYPRQYPAQ